MLETRLLEHGQELLGEVPTVVATEANTEVTQPVVIELAEDLADENIASQVELETKPTTQVDNTSNFDELDEILGRQVASATTHAVHIPSDEDETETAAKTQPPLEQKTMIATKASSFGETRNPIALYKPFAHSTFFRDAPGISVPTTRQLANYDNEDRVVFDSL